MHSWEIETPAGRDPASRLQLDTTLHWEQKELALPSNLAVDQAQ